MPQNPPKDMPRITAYLYYRDVGAASDWLVKSFGFKERLRMDGPDGKVMHAEVTMEDGVVMMGRPEIEYSSPGKYKNPRELNQVTQGLYVYVDDVDGHYERAKTAGAKILKEPEDQFYGDRRYSAVDPEGHEWFFATHVKDVAPEDMKVPA